ncbi:hypothetical protein [Arthrobacter rhombi]|uniref:hypothetical protein n=1 Tax=Arthrobacter rhombi TaxID=71253 RepID=UPI003FD666D0
MEARTAVELRTMALLIIAPICSVGLLLVLYVALGPWLAHRVAVHIGPGGVAYGPLFMLAGACRGAAAAFAIVGVTPPGLHHAHGYPTEKSIAVSLEAFEYGVVGFALATLFAMVGDAPDERTGARSVWASWLC